jgi:DNA processing protein
VRATKSSPEGLREGLAFALLPGIGGVAVRAAVERHGSAAAALHERAATADALAALVAADSLIERARSADASVLLLGEAGYPDVLLELPQPPSFLFAIGDAALVHRPRVGIVGTRQASASGERITHHIADRIAAAGGTVVSGMALGIDAAAHRGALGATGATIAVLGGGADLPYPPTHAALHRRITSAGLVLSEAPMGTRPVKGAFPRRNRIIAALSDILVVVEAGHRSGALITANHAVELGRPVAAVPGPIDSPRHAGTNQLLAAGAQFISSVDDVLALAGLSLGTTTGHSVAGPSPADFAGSDANEDAVLRAVRAGASDADGIAQATRLAAREISAALSSLEVRGSLRLDPGGAIVLGLATAPGPSPLGGAVR